jgi:acyl carrier protein
VPVSIGEPIKNTRLYLLDKWGQPVPVGVPGELYIGGDGVALGYRNRPAMTAERFVPDPFSALPGQRLYRTGDLMRYLPGGRLEFLGREDYQIKIRGFRVEPGEIEAVLEGHDSVEQACVVMRAGETGEKHLVAHVVFKAGLEPRPADHQIKDYLRTQLPEYMVPGIIVELSSLPLTANGKLDRKALPDVKVERKGNYVAPRNPIEEVLVRRWMELLKLPRIGVQDNFFDLGGHSLLATRVISRIAKDFRIDIPLLEFFSEPTIAALAGSLKTHERRPEAAEKIAKILNKVDRLSSEQIKAQVKERRVVATTSGDD